MLKVAAGARWNPLGRKHLLTAAGLEPASIDHVAAAAEHGTTDGRCIAGIKTNVPPSRRLQLGSK